MSKEEMKALVKVLDRALDTRSIFTELDMGGYEYFDKDLHETIYNVKTNLEVDLENDK